MKNDSEDSEHIRHPGTVTIVLDWDKKGDLIPVKDTRPSGKQGERQTAQRHK